MNDADRMNEHCRRPAVLYTSLWGCPRRTV